LSAAREVFAADSAGEGFVLHLALHRIRLDLEDGLSGLDQRAGGEKAGHFVAGKERSIERSLANDAGVVGVGEDGVEHLLGIAALAQDSGSGGGMAFGRVVLLIGP